MTMNHFGRTGVGAGGSPAATACLTVLAALAAALAASVGDAATLRGEGDATLTEGWRFAKDPSCKADCSAEAFDDSSWRAVRVPHDWAIEGPFVTNEPTGATGRLPWKGVGWYRLRFDVAEAEAKGCVFFDFDGVMASPEVYVNGRRAGGWDYGYASFRVDATPFVRPGANVLAVRASTLGIGSRWYPGAGIYRRVVKRTRSRAHFAYNGIFVTTPEATRQRAIVRVAWETENEPAGAKVKVRVLRNGRAVAEGTAPAALGAALLEVENPALWDVDDPALHDAEATLADADGRALSRETVRFGIRSIAFPVPDDPNDRAANGFHLNGRRVQLRGVNNHSDLGLLGMAFDKSAARRQLRIMKDMGANALRTSHNPPAPELLDLCDEMGVLVWDEAFDKWTIYGGRHEDQSLEEYVARNLVAFAKRDRNHPSVIVWSIANEIWEWDPDHPIRNAKNVFADRGPSGQTKVRNTFFRDQVRLVDTTRPVGNGNSPYMNEERIFNLGVFDPLDVVGWNYMRSYVPFKKRFPKKAVIYSESASAVSSYAFYLDDVLDGRSVSQRRRDGCIPQVDSRDLQTNIDFADEVFGYMDKDPYCCGEFVWSGFDYLGEPSPFWEAARSSYFGIVALTGLPKDRFYLYRANWNKKSPTLHMSPDTWTFPGMEGKSVPVMVYTDAEGAELFLNGRSLGRRRKGEKVELPAAMTNRQFAAYNRYRLMWVDVPYEKGELKAVAIRGGKAAEEKVLRTAGAPARLKIEVEPLMGKDEEELVWLHAYAYDAAGNRTLSANDEVEFSISGPGEILGVGNCDPCEHVPFTSPKGHRLFGGVATAVVRRTGPGALSVKASSPALSAAVAELPAPSWNAAASQGDLALPRAEFERYYERITGVRPADGLVSFAVDPGVSESGKDAYRIVSGKTAASRPAVAITGSNLRSVWYGLYDLLERRGGCRWFWDGDVVPKKANIDLSGLDVREEARFEWRGIRYFAHRGLTRFQAEHWGPEDWKREVDWCLKRRLNVFMLRIGQDDLFQRAFPDVVGYPDPSVDLPGHGMGYDNRTLFWSLRYRGELRRRVQAYAFDRGLEVPEDFGTMTHWYSRTPEDFLKKMNPPFLPQATSGYKQRNGLVWDIRDDKWVDAYWKLTTAAVDAYGRPGPGLLHTIGLGERLCYTNRADNLKLKLLALDKFLKRAHRDYPERKVLLAGWDFYFTWYPEEVQALVKTLDPRRDIIWDYEGDAVRDYRPEMQGRQNNFTKWGVVGRFPYTYSIFLAFEDALDIRANYPLIEERQKAVQGDPFCAGYVFWPESSHTDTLCLRYFTANAWAKGGVSSADVLDEFCASRYGEDAEAWKGVWRKVLPIGRLLDWGGNYGKNAVSHGKWQKKNGRSYNDSGFWETRRMPDQLAAAPGVFRALAAMDWKKTQFTERDAIDLARTTGDRLAFFARDAMLRAYHAWRKDGALAPEALRKARAYADIGALMAELLALHTDYSLAESFDRLNAVEPVKNPNFPKVLVENATCSYCASHQYEAAEYWYRPSMREFADMIAGKVSAGDRAPIPDLPGFDEYRDSHMYAKPLAEMRPALPRTQESYSRVLNALAAAADAFVE